MDSREAPPDSAPSFEKIDSWARHLDATTLLKLAREFGFADSKLLDGWVRSALFAEWGRRDPQAAMEWLSAYGDLKGKEENAVEQSWFAVFRGWAETNPSAALEGLAEHTGQANKISRMLGSDWTDHAHVELLRSYARVDADAAWEFTQANRDGDAHIYRDSINGFFGGLNSRKEVDKYVALWEPQLGEPRAIKRRTDYKDALASRSSGLIMRPLDDTMAIEVAIALGRFSLSDAWKWLSAAEGADQMRAERGMDFFAEWGRRFPEQAMEEINSAEFKGYQKILAEAVLAQDLSYAIEVMESIDDHQRRAETFRDALTMNGSGHVRDLFPVPGQPNRLPDFEGRYEATLAALEAGNFEPERKKALLGSIYDAFRHNVPAAAEAFEAGKSE